MQADIMVRTGQREGVAYVEFVGVSARGVRYLYRTYGIPLGEAVPLSPEGIAPHFDDIDNAGLWTVTVG